MLVRDWLVKALGAIEPTSPPDGRDG
jgi:hypothetical protein